MQDSDTGRVAGASPIVCLIAFGVAGVGGFLALPAIVGALAGRFQLSDAQIAQFSSVQLVCVSVGSLLAMSLSRRMTVRRMGSIALGILLVADLATSLATSFTQVLALRACAGVAGGTAVACATGALARTASADRSFGWFLLAQIVFQMVAAVLLPRLDGSVGAPSTFLALAAVDALALLLLSRVSVGGASGGEALRGGGNGARDWLVCAAVLMSILTFFMAVGSFWTFAGRLGADVAGLSPSEAGSAIGLAGFGGLAGAFLPVLLGARFGRLLPMVVAFGSLAAGLALVPGASSWSGFVAAVAMFSFGWFLLFPYQLGLLSAVDKDGRATVFSSALTGAGLGIGPALVALLVGAHAGSMPAPIAIALACVAGSAAFAAMALFGPAGGSEGGSLHEGSP